FLPVRDAIEPPVEGAAVIVQIERDGRDGKGPRVSGRPALMGPRLVLSQARKGVTISDRIIDDAERRRLEALATTLCKRGEGWIVRTAAAHAEPAVLRAEAGRLRAAWQDISRRKQADGSPSCVYREPPIDRRLLRDHGARFAEVIFDSQAPAH